MNRQDDDFVDNIRKQLDQSCENLEGETLSKLNRVRHAALERGRKRKQWLGPLVGLATAASVALVSINLWNGGNTASVPGMDIVEDIELLSSNEDLEFYENLEFYQWLEDEKPLS